MRDIIYKKLTIEQVGSSLEDAERYAIEALEVQSKQLSDKGLIVSYDIRRLRCKINRRYFVRLTVFVFGEPSAFDNVMTEEQNLPGD